MTQSAKGYILSKAIFCELCLEIPLKTSIEELGYINISKTKTSCLKDEEHDPRTCNWYTLFNSCSIMNRLGSSIAATLSPNGRGSLCTIYLHIFWADAGTQSCKYIMTDGGERRRGLRSLLVCFDDIFGELKFKSLRSHSRPSLTCIFSNTATEQSVLWNCDD